MTHGTIVLLNGASSSGKTTLGRALQRALDEPFLYFEVDDFGPMLPERYFVGPHSNWVALDPAEDTLASQGFYLQTVKAGDDALMHIKAGPIGHRLIAGMHRAVAAMASAGNNLIFADVLYDQAYLTDYLNILKEFTVWFVGVHSSLEVIEQRERQRGNRLAGHTRGHLQLVHAHGLYDIEVDTSVSNPDECAQQIVRRLTEGPSPDAFAQLRTRLNANQAH